MAKKRDAKFPVISGIWFREADADVRVRCESCIYIASLKAPVPLPPEEIAKLIAESDNLVLPFKPMKQIYMTIRWYLHLSRVDSSQDRLVAKHDIQEVTAMVRKFLNYGPIISSNSFENDNFAKSIFFRYAPQILHLQHVDDLLHRITYAVGDRVRMRRGFGVRPEMGNFTPDVPEGKVYKIRSKKLIRDTRGFQLIKVNDEGFATSQQLFLISQAKKK